MKATFIITLISLAIIHQSTSAGIEDYYRNKKCSTAEIGDTAEERGNAFSLDYCKTLDLDEKKYRCCYIHYKIKDTGTARGCKPLTYDQYKNLSKIIDEYEETYDDVSIDCNSKYLTIAALFITLVFILL